VQTAIALLSTSEALDKVLNLVQLALLDGLVNANTVLPDNASSTNVQVTDFTVAHKALGQTYGQRGGLQLGEALGSLRVGLGETRHPRGLSGSDGITLGRRVGAGNTPTVNDNCSVALALGSGDPGEGAS